MIAAANTTDLSTIVGHLSSAQKRGIKLIAEHRLYRRRNGYGIAPSSVSLDVVSSLRSLQLVRVDAASFNPCPTLTGSGQAVHAIMKQRSEQRRRA